MKPQQGARYLDRAGVDSPHRDGAPLERQTPGIQQSGARHVSGRGAFTLCTQWITIHMGHRGCGALLPAGRVNHKSVGKGGNHRNRCGVPCAFRRSTKPDRRCPVRNAVSVNEKNNRPPIDAPAVVIASNADGHPPFWSETACDRAMQSSEMLGQCPYPKNRPSSRKFCQRRSAPTDAFTEAALQMKWTLRPESFAYLSRSQGLTHAS